MVEVVAAVVVVAAIQHLYFLRLFHCLGFQIKVSPAVESSINHLYIVTRLNIFKIGGNLLFRTFLFFEGEQNWSHIRCREMFEISYYQSND